MKLVTIATHSECYFPYLKKSCERYDSELIILGWGQKWTGYSLKFQLLQSFLKDLDDEEILCFIDSFDVIMLRSLKELEYTFKNFSRDTGTRVVIGYDRTYYKIIELIGSIYFGTVNGYTINSGTYIGYVKDLKNIINSIYSDPKLDDQKLLTEYCRKNPNQIYIDITGIFFLTINNPFGNFYDYTIMKIDEDKNLWYGGVRPFFIHGNGNTNMNDIIILLGYNINTEDIKNLEKFNKNAQIRKIKWYTNEFFRENYIFIFILLFLFFCCLKNINIKKII
jgi:hypothetical protein